MHKYFAGISMLAVTLVLAACEEPVIEPAILATASNIDTEIVTRSTVPRETEFDGQIEAVNQSTLSAQTNGRIVALPFDVGDSVQQGELIVRISSTEQSARLDNATAAVAEADARWQEARAQYERIDKIYAQRLISKAELDAAQANLNAARARFESAKAMLKEATQAAAYTQVYAPFSGLVVQKHVELGESVSVGQPLMTGLSLSPLRAAVDIPLEHIGPLRQHREARIVLPNGLSVQATQLRLPPNANPATHTFRVLALLPESDYELFPGMLVKVAFLSGEQELLLLPAEALVHRGEVTGAYVLDQDNRLSFRYLRLGSQTADGKWPILSGLADGEHVATDPIAAALAYRGKESEQ